jgi:predicted transcriptional regulator
MEEKKSQTFRIKRETFKVSQEVKDKLKTYNSAKKKIIAAMGEEELNIPQISEKIEMSKADTLYYLMTLLKFGMVEVVGMDDMDEYYIYKLKK